MATKTYGYTSNKLAPLERFELPTSSFEAKQSSPLIYKGIILKLVARAQTCTGLIGLMKAQRLLPINLAINGRLSASRLKALSSAASPSVCLRTITEPKFNWLRAGVTLSIPFWLMRPKSVYRNPRLIYTSIISSNTFNSFSFITINFLSVTAFHFNLSRSVS